MSINLDEFYIENLQKYVGEKFYFFKGKNSIEVIDNQEVKYILKSLTENNYRFYYKEREKNVEIAIYSSELEMKRNFAITIDRLIGKKFSYKNGSEFKRIKDISIVEKLMNLYVGKKYYSIKSSEEMKINLEKVSENIYSIYFLGKDGKREYKEENLEVPFAFFRFYSEAVFLKRTIEEINAYEIIFKDMLKEQEKYELILKYL